MKTVMMIATPGDLLRALRINDARSGDVDRCGTSVFMRSKRADMRHRCSIKRQSVAASQLLTAAYGHGAERLSELAHATRKTDNGRLWLPAAHARRPQHRGRCSGRLRRLALTYSVTVTLVFQKRYLLRDLRLQIVPWSMLVAASL